MRHFPRGHLRVHYPLLWLIYHLQTEFWVLNEIQKSKLTRSASDVFTRYNDRSGPILEDRVGAAPTALPAATAVGHETG